MSIFSKPPGDGRKQYLEWLRADRKARLEKTAADYERLPENIRAAISKVAGVPNRRLTELDAAQRRALKMAAKSLVNKVTAAWGLLVRADFSE